MRAVASIGLLYLAFLLLALKAVVVCSVANNYFPPFDVPRCGGTACYKMAYPYPGSYQYYSGRSWELVNEVRESIEETRDVCGSPLFDENGNLLRGVKKKLRLLGNSLQRTVDDLVYTTSKANGAALSELYTAMRNVEMAGIRKTTESDWLDLYNEIYTVFEDLNSGGERTELSRLFREMKVGKVGPIRNASTITLYSLGRVFRIVKPLIPTAQTLLDIIGTPTNMDAVVYYVNRSVGMNGSIRKRVFDVRKRYEEMKEDLDKRAEHLLENARDISKRMYTLLTQLREYNLSDLASFLPSRTSVGKLVVNLRYTPAFSISLSRRYMSDIETNFSRYSSGYRFLESFENMKKSYRELESLYSEVNKFLSTLEGAVNRCKKEVSSHEFHSGTLEAEASIELYAMKRMSLPDKVISCKRLLKLLEKDKKLADTRRAAHNCVEEYKKLWKGTPTCDYSDPALLLSCCEREMEARESELRSSDMYVRFQKLYSDVEEALIGSGSSDLLLKLYTIDRSPRNWDELKDSYSRLISLLDDVGEELSGNVVVEWNGVLSSEGMSEVELQIENPLSFPVRGMVEIPFSYYGYEVESNDMVVKVSGYKVEYKGTGGAIVFFSAKPVDIERRSIGSEDGYVLVLLENPYPLPVRVYAPGGLISHGGGVSYEEGKLLLSPGSTAVVRVPALDVNVSQRDDTISFLITNTSPFVYNGALRLDVNASSYPSYCFPSSTFLLCKVKVGPGESRVIRVKGYLLEGSGEGPNIKIKSPVKTSLLSSTAGQIRIKDGTDDEYYKLLKELESFWKRAKELNATDVLPYTYNTIENLRSLDDGLKPSAVPLLRHLVNEVKARAEAKTRLLEKLAKVSDDPEMDSISTMARKSLLSGDYVLPLVLSRGIVRYFERGSGNGSSVPWLLVLVVLLVGLSALKIKPRKKKRIPRF